jgi:hypothetical protein
LHPRSSKMKSQERKSKKSSWMMENPSGVKVA